MTKSPLQTLSHQNELPLYLADPDTEIISLNRYPHIREIFLKYNACTPSSAPVERLFSAASLIKTPRRNRLADSHFEMMLLLKYNNSL